jgi:methionine synthase II (cobalamin-independent)
MPLPTEPVGSPPRPAKLPAAITDHHHGGIGREHWTREQDAACRDSSRRRMEASGAPLVADGEQHASSFAAYTLTDDLAGTGLAESIAGDGQYFLEQAMASTKLGS